ncbi:RHS repeat-associated core domain-containing protein [Burkholderia contaminans]|nr:RHS repeat-associated core domain-containing protein [Burkholderia contaminans]
MTKDRLGIATTHFEYDAFGRRIRKLNGSYASTDFLWDGMRLVQETYHDRQGEEALTYLYESNSYVPLARIDQGKAAANDADVRDAVYYFHNDVSGFPEELTDAGGELVWQARYKVWGNAVQEEWIARVPQRPAAAWGQVSVAAPTSIHAPRPQNLRFQGQYLDRETGLHYNTFRFYDPDIGRFINPDPIGLMGGVNFYAYAPNSLGWVDPLGLSCGETPRAKPSNSSLASRIRGMLNLYPEVVDPRTGRSIPFPSGIGGKVPVADRVSWGATERGNFIKEWYDRGYLTPRGGWAEYDIHHIQPREFGASSAEKPSGIVQCILERF